MPLLPSGWRVVHIKCEPENCLERCQEWQEGDDVIGGPNVQREKVYKDDETGICSWN